MKKNLLTVRRNTTCRQWELEGTLNKGSVLNPKTHQEEPVTEEIFECHPKKSGVLAVYNRCYQDVAGLKIL
jgi:hypothetical protein